jgi:hypothetical protein
MFNLFDHIAIGPWCLFVQTKTNADNGSKKKIGKWLQDHWECMRNDQLYGFVFIWKDRTNAPDIWYYWIAEQKWTKLALFEINRLIPEVTPVPQGDNSDTKE